MIAKHNRKVSLKKRLPASSGWSTNITVNSFSHFVQHKDPMEDVDREVCRLCWQKSVFWKCTFLLLFSNKSIIWIPSFFFVVVASRQRRVGLKRETAFAPTLTIIRYKGKVTGSNGEKQGLRKWMITYTVPACHFTFCCLGCLKQRLLTAPGVGIAGKPEKVTWTKRFFRPCLHWRRAAASILLLQQRWELGQDPNPHRHTEDYWTSAR